jgi:hypothetical protein
MVLDARKSGLRVRPKVLAGDRRKYSGFIDWRGHKKGALDEGSHKILRRHKSLGRFIVSSGIYVQLTTDGSTHGR